MCCIKCCVIATCHVLPASSNNLVMKNLYGRFDVNFFKEVYLLLIIIINYYYYYYLILLLLLIIINYYYLILPRITSLVLIALLSMRVLRSRSKLYVKLSFELRNSLRSIRQPRKNRRQWGSHAGSNSHRSENPGSK